VKGKKRRKKGGEEKEKKKKRDYIHTIQCFYYFFTRVGY
jgi:hypothetical protein